MKHIPIPESIKKHSLKGVTFSEDPMPVKPLSRTAQSEPITFRYPAGSFQGTVEFADDGLRFWFHGIPQSLLNTFRAVFDDLNRPHDTAFMVRIPSAHSQDTVRAGQNALEDVIRAWHELQIITRDTP